MRILIIAKFFPPENSVASLRPYSWAKHWTLEGHDVSVLTTVKAKGKKEDLKIDNDLNIHIHEVDYSPFFYKLKRIYKSNIKVNTLNDLSPEAVSDEQKVSQVKESHLKKVRGRINDYIIDKGIFLGQRMPDTTDLWISPAVNWARLNGPWDLVVSSHAPYACHIIGYKLKKANLTKFWLADFRDLWTDHHIFKGLFPFTYIETYLERNLMKETDAITTVSKPLATTLSKKYGIAKTYVIENGFDPDDLLNISNKSVFTDGKVRILYTGTIYKGKQDPKLLFESISELAQNENISDLLDNLEVLFVGSTNNYVLAQAQAMGISKWVKGGGFQPREEVLRMQRDAHVLLFLEFESGKTEGILTGKLFEYLFSETEIWALGVIQSASTGNIISQANAGLLFGNNKEYLKQELIRLLTQPEKKKQVINRSFLKQFERKALASKMLQIASKGL